MLRHIVRVTDTRYTKWRNGWMDERVDIFSKNRWRGLSIFFRRVE